MKARRTLIISLVVVCSVCVVVVLSKTRFAAGSTPSFLKPQNEDSFETPFHRLRAKVLDAKSNSQSSIDNLADAVIDDFFPGNLPSDARQLMHDRIVRAELVYRNGGQGIAEGNIVRTINDLADKLGTPEYTKTSRGQVRFLRVNMMNLLPQLIGQEPKASKKDARKPQSSMSLKMSPVEAVFLTALMIQQKAHNEDYQIEPKDWRSYRHQKAIELWRSYRESKGAVRKASGPQLSVRSLNPKSQAIAIAISQKSKIGESQSGNLMVHSLDVLGISR